MADTFTVAHGGTCDDCGTTATLAGHGMPDLPDKMVGEGSLVIACPVCEAPEVHLRVVGITLDPWNPVNDDEDEEG